jgi:hypothetical protein
LFAVAAMPNLPAGPAHPPSVGSNRTAWPRCALAENPCRTPELDPQYVQVLSCAPRSQRCLDGVGAETREIKERKQRRTSSS